MGHRIQSYTLSELKRISVPGAVAPCLFWALPIGSWRPKELDEMWRYFAEADNEARKYGLLIVLDTEGHGSKQSLDLQMLGAKLQEVVPRGLERQLRPSVFELNKRRMLILSGGYPQPGWGVLVELSGGAESFGNLIRRSLATLDPDGAADVRLKPFTDARELLMKFRGPDSMVKPSGDFGLRRSQQVSEWGSPSAVSDVRPQFHKAMGAAVELQCELGAQFLVSFEEISHKDGLWKRTIPWDPARMVGWKIFCAGEPFVVSDLEHGTKYRRPYLHGGASRESEKELADGGHFADYVHHSASSGPVREPRGITRKLLEKLLRESHQKRLISKYGGTAEGGPGAKPLVEQLLETLGWYSEGERETPLAACVTKGIGESWKLKNGMNASSVRIVLESFCKDLLDVVVCKLGYNHQEIWDALQERCPDYKIRSVKKNWIEEVGNLSSGSAMFLIKALAPLVFPEPKVTKITRVLNRLIEIGNEAAHHMERGRVVRGSKEMPTLIRQLLESTSEMLGELPWHLTVDNVFGSLPKVLSGEAWSHGSPMSRRLKVILWEGEAYERWATIWNPSRRNPVVVDPVFISRPGPE